MERSEDSKHTGKLSDDEENKKRVSKSKFKKGTNIFLIYV